MTVTEFPGLQPVDGPPDRLPPQDLAAEQCVLGSMLMSKDAIADVVESVRGVDFYRPAHETVYEAILDLYGRGEPADAVTVAAELQRKSELGRVGGAPYIHTLMSMVPSAANAGYYAAIVREKAILRRLVEAGTRITQFGYAGDGDVDDIVDRAQAEIYGVTDNKGSEDYAPLGEVMEATLDEIEAIGSRGGQMIGVPTGISDLDALTNGLHPGQMIIIAARPGVGKSLTALNFSRAASIHNGLTSVIFSLEMSRTEITMRLLSAEARIPLNHMRQGTMSDDDWARLARKMGEISEAPLYIDDSPNMTMMEIRAKCRRLRQRHDLRLVIIDYLQLMTSGKRVESRQVEVSEFSRSLKLLAKELEIPVVALAQLNRGPEQRTDKRPMLSDLRESGCVTASTRIMRADTGAEVTIGELVSSGERNVPVWSLDERLKYVPRTMTHAFPSGTKEVFRLGLASGRTVEATANHPFLTYAGWKPLGELMVGARVSVARQIPQPLDTKPWDEDEIILLGHLIGDGSFVHRQPIRYASVDEANLRAVSGAAKRRFGITVVRDEYAAARVTTLRLPAPYHLTHGKRNPIAEWLDGLGLFGLRSHEKFVPEGIFSLPDEQVALFLRHLWATDGSVQWHRTQERGVVYYASTSRRLVDDIARLLLRFDIFTRIKVARKDGYRTGYHLHLMDSASQLKFLSEIGVHGARGRLGEDVASRLEAVRPRANLDTVPEEVWERVQDALTARSMSNKELALAIGSTSSTVIRAGHSVGRTRLAEIAAVLDCEELELLATNDILWDRVLSIESIGEHEVFDATVLGTHNFLANGIALHNSLEQDADMVVLLHREDAYERESARPGEADFIVAKHRNGPTANITVAFQGHYSRFVDMAQG